MAISMRGGGSRVDRVEREEVREYGVIEPCAEVVGVDAGNPGLRESVRNI